MYYIGHGPEVAKHDDVLGIEGDDKLSAVALKCYQPSRSLDVRGQLNLFNHSASISVLTLSMIAAPSPAVERSCQARSR